MTAVRSRLVLALSLLTVPLAIAACQPTPEPPSAIPPLAGTEPNGEQNRTATQLLADARTSLTSASALELTGSLLLDGTPLTVNLVVRADGTLSGTAALQSAGPSGGSMQLQVTATSLYVRSTGTPELLAAVLGLPAVMARPAPRSAFWQIDAATAPTVGTLTLPTLATTLLPPQLLAKGGLTAGDVNGTPSRHSRFRWWIGVRGRHRRHPSRPAGRRCGRGRRRDHHLHTAPGTGDPGRDAHPLAPGPSPCRRTVLGHRRPATEEFP